MVDPTMLRPARQASPIPDRLALDHAYAPGYQPPPLDAVLPGLCPGEVGILYGPSTAGKSWWALELAHQLITGVDLLGIGTQARGGWIEYWTGEDSPRDFEQRLSCLAAYLRGLGVPDDRVDQCPERIAYRSFADAAPDLCSDRWVKAAVAAACPEGQPDLALLVLDTLGDFHMLDEDHNAQARQILRGARHLAQRTGAAVLLLHHTSKYAELNGTAGMKEGARGAGDLINKPRWSASLTPLTQDEATERDIPEADRDQWLHWRVSKSNRLPRPWPSGLLHRERGGLLVHGHGTPVTGPPIRSAPATPSGPGGMTLTANDNGGWAE